MGMFISSGGLPITPLTSIIDYSANPNAKTWNSPTGLVNINKVRYARVCVHYEDPGADDNTHFGVRVAVGSNNIDTILSSTIHAKKSNLYVDIFFNKAAQTMDYYIFQAQIDQITGVIQSQNINYGVNVDVSGGANIVVSGDSNNVNFTNVSANVDVFNDG